MASGLFGKKTSGATPGARPGGAAPAPPQTELSSIDFSGADISRALAECADLVEVQEVGAGIGAIYEEAAVLYANGGAREAEVLLEAAVSDQVGKAGEGLWMMLLDLYQLTGQRERFESRVLDYATRFERSPPPWVNLTSAQPRRKADVVPLINLNGALSEPARQQLEQISIIGQRSGSIRIDLKRLRSADATGCRMLLDAITGLLRERVKVFLLNAGQLVPLLESQIEVGRAEGREIWLLLLELLQHTGESARFEDLAVDYAVTFEESPPSWENRPQPPAAMMAGPEEDDAEDEDSPRLEGEMTGTNNEGIKKIAALAAERPAVTVDCSQLRRMDFVSAGTLFNVLATLRTQGKQVSLRNVNAMVGALLRVMGVDQVAQVTLRH